MNGCVFSTDESGRMVSISQDRTLKIWDVSTQKQLRSTTFISACWALDMSRSESTFATAHKTGEAKIWSMSEMKEV